MRNSQHLLLSNSFPTFFHFDEIFFPFFLADKIEKLRIKISEKEIELCCEHVCTFFKYIFVWTSLHYGKCLREKLMFQLKSVYRRNFITKLIRVFIQLFMLKRKRNVYRSVNVNALVERPHFSSFLFFPTSEIKFVIVHSWYYSHYQLWVYILSKKSVEKFFILNIFC